MCVCVCVYIYIYICIYNYVKHDGTILHNIYLSFPFYWHTTRRFPSFNPCSNLCTTTPCTIYTYPIQEVPDINIRVQHCWAHRTLVPPPIEKGCTCSRTRHVVWDTALKDGRSRVRFPLVSSEFSIHLIFPGRIISLGSIQPLKKMSNYNIPWGVKASGA